MNEELDSQLSAMFDDELPEAECQLLARRLSRDDALKARWRRYAVMGAALRAERAGEQGIRLETNIAARVSSAISAEPALTGEVVAKGESEKSAGWRWWQPIAGGAIAAGVAAMSVLWIRAQGPIGDEARVAQNAAGSGAAVIQPQQVAQRVEDSAPDSYVVPASVDRTPIVPPAELANYVVAHSEFSAPITRRIPLSALIASESGTAAPPEMSENANVVEDAEPNVEQAE